MRRTFQDLESGKLRRHKESLSCQKALQELNAEKNALRQKLQELDAKRELQQQLFDKFMITTRAQLELQRAEIEAIECLAAASSSELVIRSLEVVEPIKNSLAQSLAELVYEMCAHYSSFTRDSTRNVYDPILRRLSHFAIAALHIADSYFLLSYFFALVLCFDDPLTFFAYAFFCRSSLRRLKDTFR